MGNGFAGRADSKSPPCSFVQLGIVTDIWLSSESLILLRGLKLGDQLRNLCGIRRLGRIFEPFKLKEVEDAVNRAVGWHQELKSQNEALPDGIVADNDRLSR